jgi:hypothetical protein
MTADLARIAYAAGSVTIAPRADSPIVPAFPPTRCTSCGTIFRADCPRCFAAIRAAADSAILA